MNLNANVSSNAYTRIDALKYHSSVSCVSLHTIVYVQMLYFHTSISLFRGTLAGPDITSEVEEFNVT